MPLKATLGELCSPGVGLPRESPCPGGRGFLEIKLAVGGHVTMLAICLSLTPKCGVFRLLSWTSAPEDTRPGLLLTWWLSVPAGPLLSCVPLELALSYHEIPLGFSWR